jgi:D-alanine-D-alanine ligase
MRVAVVQGGPSTEAEVSRASAASVARALVEAGHDVTKLELDAQLAEAIRTGAFDVVFPVVHGAVGEDGALQGLLEVLGATYVGSDVVASAVAMHKRLARRIFAAAGLPAAKGIELERGDARAAAERARREVGDRVVVKPSASGSAIGVSRIDEGEPVEAVVRALEAVWELDDVAIVEHFAKGREVTCGVLDLARDGASVAAPHRVRDFAVALPPTEIFSPKDPFYTYEARYAPGRSVHECPAKLPAEVTARVQEVAVAAHRALGCRDLSRVDFIVGDSAEHPSTVTLLEVNTMPGFTDTSLFPEAASVHGLPMAQLCDALVRQAFSRGPTRRNVAKPLPR